MIKSSETRIVREAKAMKKCVEHQNWCNDLDVSIAGDNIENHVQGEILRNNLCVSEKFLNEPIDGGE